MNKTGSEPTIAPPAEPELDNFNREWELLRPLAYAMRAGHLERVEVADYRKSLERVVAKFPRHAVIWNELLLVTISYQKDAAGSLDVVERALQYFPESPEFLRRRAITERWIMEQQR